MKNKLCIASRAMGFILVAFAGVCIAFGIIYHEGNISPDGFFSEGIGAVSAYFLLGGIFSLIISTTFEGAADNKRKRRFEHV